MRFGILVFFFFKQKTAYEVRISDWSSDVCSSDLDAIAAKGAAGARRHFGVRAQAVWAIMAEEGLIAPLAEGQAPDSRYAFLCWDGWDEERDAEDRPVRAAGDRFGIRPDQLSLFLIAAQEARLAMLEQDRKSTSLNSSNECATRKP